MNQSLKPTRKVGAGMLAGALSIIVVWAAGLAGLTIPSEVAQSLTVILTFATSWLIKE